jgi:hypothetical protein
MAAIPPTDRDATIAGALVAMEQGKSLREIAEGLGIAHTTLRGWLLSGGPQQYADIKQRGLVARIAEADENLEKADSLLAAQKWRDIGKFARWDAERRLPHLFATRQEVTGAGGGPIVLTDFQRAQRYAFLERVVREARIEGEASVLHEESPEPEPEPEPVHVKPKRALLVGAPSMRRPFRS